MENLDLIQDLLTEEIGVIPVNKNKTPKLPKGHPYLYERIDPEQIEGLFSDAYGMAIAGGAVSDGIECIDFDDHTGKRSIEAKLREYCSNPFVRGLIDENKIYVQKTPSGGYHIIYRYKADTYEGSKKLAFWPDNEVMLETRGNGGYFITYPTPGYEKLYNDYFSLRSIEKDDRDLLLQIAGTFDLRPKAEGETSAGESKYKPFDPVSYYNFKCGSHARNLLRDNGWKCNNPKEEVQRWIRPGKNQGTSATFGFKDNAFFVFTSNGMPFENGVFYSPFEILAILEFKKDWQAAYNWVMQKYLSADVPYVRIGTNYFKKIKNRDRFGILRNELKVWTKDEIKTDHGAAYLKSIPHFDTFTIQPDNKKYKPIIDNCYNLYSDFPHRPDSGSWKWSKILMEHIFGDQYEIGMRYIQSLYQNPKKALPILALVSKERSTGKTTFLNWLNMIFGENMVVIDPNDITSSFNSLYAYSNIIAVEETMIDKKHTIEKVKALSTGKFISVNQKFVASYKLPFYGHIIMTSNEKDRFINIDEEEIRFFVRELSKPKHSNFNIEEDVIAEIPAFLAHLDSLPPLDYSKSRALFTPEEIANDNLATIKRESKTWLFEELTTELQSYFDENSHIKEFFATIKDIKTEFFAHNHKVDYRYLRKVLNEEMKLKQQKMMRYVPFSRSGSETRPGTPYLFTREDYTKSIPNEAESCPF
jgi:hypothetical protein